MEIAPYHKSADSDGDHEAEAEFVDDKLRRAGVVGERGKDRLDKKVVAAVEDGGGPEALGTES